MDSNSVVAIIALLCFFFFFFFFLLGGVSFYFFIVKKKETFEEKTMASQTRIPLEPLSPIVSPLLKKYETFDISEDKLFKDCKERLKSIETFLGSSYKNRNDAEFVKKYGRPENMDDLDNTHRVNLNQSRIFELQNTVSGLQKEKVLKEKETDLEQENRIETKTKLLLDNLNNSNAFLENSMEQRIISLSGPIEDAVLQELYRLDKSVHYKSSSDLFEGKMKIFYFLEKFSSPNKVNVEVSEPTPKM